MMAIQMLWLLIFVIYIPTFIFSDDTTSNETLLVILTMSGDIILTDRMTGKVIWKSQSDLVSHSEYNGGPIIIADPYDGRLYKYSDDPSDDIIYKIDASVGDMVARSPEMLEHLYSSGHKSDHWLHLELETGRNLNLSVPSFLNECRATSMPTLSSGSDNRSEQDLHNVLSIGVSLYQFFLWDMLTGTVRLNITLRTFVSHAESDLQNSDVTHIATLEPSLLTFNKSKFLWSLHLSSPVVNLFTVFTPPCDTFSSASTSPFLRKRLRPKHLRRIIFTTYAIHLNLSHLPSHHLTRLDEARFWEEKFNAALNLVPALYIGVSENTQLYAIRTMSEGDHLLRATRRISRIFQIDSAHPIKWPAPTTSQVSTQRYLPFSSAGWLHSLCGFYELSNEFPRSDPAWRFKFKADSHKAKRISDSSRASFSLTPACGMTITMPKKQSNLQFWIIFIVALLGSTIFIFLRFIKSDIKKTQTTQLSMEMKRLHDDFDFCDAEGWAGQFYNDQSPTVRLRFNHNTILGKGSNDTFVFAGTYGLEQIAVKRIPRGSSTERSWLRLEQILINYRHANFIHCYLSHSTSSFHYLVLQRCVTTLAELMSGQRDDDREPKSLTLDGLTLCPVMMLRQLFTAVAFLHKNEIVHGDIKPSNVLLVRDRTTIPHTHRLVLADPRLISDLSLETTLVTHNLKWMAPEIVQDESITLTKAADVYATGLVTFFILTLGGHPFDDYDEDNSQYSERRPSLEPIIAPPCCLSSGNTLYQGLLAIQIIEQALYIESSERPSIDSLLKNPLFWSPAKILSFLVCISNFLEENTGSDLYCDLRIKFSNVFENCSRFIFCNNWLSCLDEQMVVNLTNTRIYNGNSAVALLRAIRNKLGHYFSLNNYGLSTLSSLPSTVNYWFSIYPGMLPVIFCITCDHLCEVSFFKTYLNSHYCQINMDSFWNCCTSVALKISLQLEPKSTVFERSQIEKKQTTTRKRVRWYRGINSNNATLSP